VGHEQHAGRHFTAMLRGPWVQGAEMSPLLKEALKRENAFKRIESRKNDFTNDELKLNWLDGLGVCFVLIAIFLMLNFI
jgi:hypothetical protein